MATRTLRGALAGAAAAAVWAAQQPLDRRVFGVAYDDTELLGRWVVPSGGAVAAGRRRAPRRQRRAVRRGLRERRAVAARARRRCAGRSPGSPSTSRPGPGPRCSTACTRRADLPQLWGSGRAFAQATWRHVLFGFVLGELERRLNPPEDAPAPVDDAVASTNGHGSAEHLVAPGPAQP